ncbi:polysaccharide deacetylase family protein [Achromobacter xylosoxidans]
MSKQILFSLDLEDHLGRYDGASRYPEVTRRVMSALAERNIKGTVFTVARIAEREPALLREIAALGHEIACQSMDHTPLDKQSPKQLRENTARAKGILENCIGQEIAGYRAPIFSLVERTAWFVDDLRRLGFSYSSSVMPTRTPLYGFPGAPQEPFKWHNDLVELPCPVGKLGSATLPYLGGFYLRYIPQAIINKLLSQASNQSCLWTYCHPYDFDAEEPFARISGAALWTSVLLWFNRRNTMCKILNLVGRESATTLNAWVDSHSHALPTFEYKPKPAAE